MNSFLKTSLALIMLFLVGGVLFYTYEPKIAEAGWYMTGGTWSYRKIITINNSKVEGSSDLTNFPILVDLTDADLASYAQADGDDILFTSSDGTTKLDHEIELYTTATGRLTAWVEIPTLDYDNDTVIYMYYGNSGASNQENVTGVWDSNYKGVWHMGESATVASDLVLDSTSNANNASSTGTSFPVLATGKIGSGQDFDGSNDYLRVTKDDDSLDANWTSTNYTFEGWINYDNNNANYKRIMTKWDGSKGWAYDGGDGPTQNTRPDLYANDAAQQALTRVDADLSLDTWHHVVIVAEGNSTLGRIYVNGAFVTLQYDNDWIDIDDTSNTTHMAIGILSNDLSSPWDGLLDELRISNTARSAGWIATEYNNQSATSTFYSISSIAQTSDPTDVKIRGGGSATNSNVKIRGGLGWYSTDWGYRKPITINKSKVSNSDQSNFPVLIDLTDANLSSRAQSDGDDILFTLGNGTTKLDHEIELYTTATGRLTAWVRVPTLYAERDTTIYMYYGNSGASSQQNITGVWNSNYKGVWHLKDGTTLNSEDSTSNNLDGTQTSSPTATTGQIDGGMNNSGGGYLNLGTSMPSVPNLTVSAWIKMNTVAYTKSFVSDGYDGVNGTGYELRIIDSGEGGFGDHRVSFGSYVQGEPLPDGVYSTAAMPASSWNYWTGTYDGTTWRLYKNGTQDNSNADTGPVSTTARGGIGALDVNGTFGRVPDAVMDEVRVSDTARSANWISTEYNNQSATSTFYTAGSEETNGNAPTRGGVKFR